MKVDLMRAIDFFIGVPITFVLTVFYKVKYFFLSKKKVTPKKILFMELSEMGSTILADPAMRKAKEYFDADLYFCIFAKNKQSLALLNTVPDENIYILRDDHFLNLIADAFDFLFWARKKNIDTVIDLELFARVTAILTGMSGARNKVGFYSFHNEGLYRGRMLTHEVSYNPHIHIAKNFMALVNSLISDNGEVPYSKTLITDSDINLQKAFVSEEEKVSLWNKVKAIYPPLDKENHHFILMNPNASDLLPQRRWPMENFSKLIEMVLNEDESAIVLITGSSSEKEEMQKLSIEVNHQRCINIAGLVSFGELPTLYTISTLLVTNDSGPGHFSAVTDIPSFVLFGPETPLLYGSLGNSTSLYAGLACSPCVSASNHRKTSCKDNVCLQEIGPQMVFEKIKPLLKGVTV